MTVEIELKGLCFKKWLGVYWKRNGLPSVAFVELIYGEGKEVRVGFWGGECGGLGLEWAHEEVIDNSWYFVI